MSSQILSYLLVSIALYGTTFVGLTLLTGNLVRTGFCGVAIQSVIVVQTYKLAVMVLLSLFGKLVDLYLYTIFITVALLLVIQVLVCLRYTGSLTPLVRWLRGSRCALFADRGVDCGKYFPKVLSALLIVLFATWLGLLAIKGVFFADTTYDSQTYGLPKIALYLQNQSIFHLTQAPDVRINAYERNGELNFLHAILASGGHVGALGLAAIEVWFAILLGVAGLGRALGLGVKMALLNAFAIATAPVVFGMSGITKGDAIAGAFVLYAVFYLVRLAGERPLPWWSFFFMTSLALACGAKITSAFAILGLVAVGLVNLKKIPVPSGWEVVLTVFSCAIASSKPLQNLWVYGEPLKRTEWESQVSEVSTSNLASALIDVWAWLVPSGSHLAVSGYMNDMEKSMGLTFVGIVLALALICCWVRGSVRGAGGQLGSQPMYTNVPVQIGTVMIVGVFAIAAHLPVGLPGLAGHWTRFLIPYALVIASLLSATVVNCSSRKSLGTVFMVALLGALVFFNLAQATRPSSVLTSYGRLDMLKQIASGEKVQSSYFGQDSQNQLAEILRPVSPSIRRVKVVQLDGDAPIIAAFGPSFTWRVDLVQGAKKLKTAHQSDHEMIFVTTAEPRSVISLLREVRAGYVPIWHGEKAVAFLREDLVVHCGQ